MILIAILVGLANVVFSGGHMIRKVLWGLAALIAVIAAWNETMKGGGS